MFVLTLQSYDDFSCKIIAHLVHLPYHKCGISVKNTLKVQVLSKNYALFRVRDGMRMWDVMCSFIQKFHRGMQIN